MKKYAQWTPGKKAFAALLAALVAAGPAVAQDVVKANNTDDLNLNSSWTGGSVPSASNVAVWDNTVTSDNTTLLGADLEFQGIRVANPGGLVTISAGNTLTLGSAGIDMISATRRLIIAAPVSLSSAQTWDVTSGLLLDSNNNVNNGGIAIDNQGHTLTVQGGGDTDIGELTGSGGIIKNGSGWLRIQSNSSDVYDYTGNVTINSGTVRLGNRTGSLGSGASALTLNGGRLIFVSNFANTDYGRNTTVSGDVELYNNNSTNTSATGYSFGTLSMGAHTLTVNRNIGGTTEGNFTFGATTLTGNGTFEVGDHGTDPAALNQLTLGAVGESGGARDLTKTGAGTLILTGANSYTGVTDVQAGTLQLGASSDLAGTSGIQLANGATLDVAALTGGLTLGSSQSLGGAGTVSGDLVFGSGATLDFDPAQTLTVTGALSFDNSFGVTSLNVADWSLIGEDTYTLISNGGDFSNITNWGLGNAADIGGGRSAYFQEGSLQLVVIPEPSTLVLFGLALLGVAAFRKRR